MAHPCKWKFGLLIIMSALVIVIAGCSSTSTTYEAGALPALEADQSTPPSGIPRQYVAPLGLANDEFGESLSDLRFHHPRLRQFGEPTAVESLGETHDVDFSGCLAFDPSGACRNPIIKYSASGARTLILAEYYIEAEYEGFTVGHLFDSTGGRLAPVLIDVCVAYAGRGEQVVPNTVAQDARVCGFRGFHHTVISTSPSPEATSESNTDIPMYRRVLFGIIDSYGYPQHYQPIGRVIIELSDGTQLSSSSHPRYIDYHWGKGSDEVTVDYAFNPTDGVGTVFLANKSARDYAQMRHDLGDRNFLLWRLHQAGGLNHKEVPSDYQHGSLGVQDLEDRVDTGRLSPRVRALFATSSP
jgi:hypothetical protein